MLLLIYEIIVVFKSEGGPQNWLGTYLYLQVDDTHKKRDQSLMSEFSIQQYCTLLNIYYNTFHFKTCVIFEIVL